MEAKVLFRVPKIISVSDFRNEDIDYEKLLKGESVTIQGKSGKKYDIIPDHKDISNQYLAVCPKPGSSSKFVADDSFDATATICIHIESSVIVEDEGKAMESKSLQVEKSKKHSKSEKKEKQSEKKKEGKDEKKEKSSGKRRHSEKKHKKHHKKNKKASSAE
ncbi:hypothetical protein ADUPG1_006388 [Aduncisulcus paluster]|uniref:Uncharacterized protein n=1 Tax=Aduncisulcus paluster TaxID=2918883 RepID=A0ABQ5KI32_9EUKA|nr:hypothetical protein ADUPG1_006388 [Aduncisulcus paluster]